MKIFLFLLGMIIFFFFSFHVSFSFFFIRIKTYESVPCGDGRRCRGRQSVFKLHKVRSDSDVKETGNYYFIVFSFKNRLNQKPIKCNVAEMRKARPSCT